VRGSWWHSSSAASAITAGGSARGSSSLVRWWKIVPGVGTTLVGARALTAMLSSYSSAARPVENRSSAALHIPYTVAPSGARSAGTAECRAATEEMFRIQPAPRARMPGSRSVASWNGASTWTANMSA
jgi:hypothetical protein